MAHSYGDLLIRIRALDRDRQLYPTEAELDDGSTFKDGLRLDLVALRSELNAEVHGLVLFDALFTGRLRTAYDRAIARAEALTQGRLRIRLDIDEAAADLHTLHWERLHHRYGTQAVALTTSPTTPFSRHTGLEIPEPLPVSERPLRLLVAIANPLELGRFGRAPIDVAQEVQTLTDAIGDLRYGNVMEVTLLPGRTGIPADLRIRLVDQGYKIYDGMTSLEQVLRWLPGSHLLHFIGHGAFAVQASADNTREAALFLERNDGAVQIVNEGDLVRRLLSAQPLPHLMFLAACDSAGQEDEHPFVGLAPKLVQAGVPAVVAMQGKVPMAAARQLTADFYRNLIDHGEIDRALNQARLLLYNQQTPDWSIPVLYTRLKRALIDVSRQPMPCATATGINPFEFGNPVAPEQFYGRARQKSDVKNRIGAKSAQSISIVGHRRSGKSSLLRYITERIHEFSPPQQQPMVVSLDLQDARYHSPAGIIEGIRSGIQRITGAEPWTQTQNEDYEAVENGLRMIRSHSRLILLFDEFERISKRLPEFEGWGEDFRSKASTKHLFTLVIASMRPLDEVYESLQLTSPFGNIFTMTFLGTLEANAWRSLVQKEFAESGANLHPADLELIDELAGGLPFYTQMAASMIWQLGNRQEAREEFTVQAIPHFTALWRALNQREHHAILYAVGTPGLAAPPPAIATRLRRHGLLRENGRLFSSAFADFVRGQL